MAVLDIIAEPNAVYQEYICRSYTNARNGVTLAWPDDWNLYPSSAQMVIGQRLTGNGNPLNPFMRHVRQGYLDFNVPDLGGAVVESAELFMVSASSSVAIDFTIEVYEPSPEWGPTIDWVDDWNSPTSGDFELLPLLATYNTADGLANDAALEFTTVDLLDHISTGHHYWFVSTDRIRLGNGPQSSPNIDQISVHSAYATDPSFRPFLRITSEDPLPDPPPPAIFAPAPARKHASPAVVLVSPDGKPVYL